MYFNTDVLSDLKVAVDLLLNILSTLTAKAVAANSSLGMVSRFNAHQECYNVDFSLCSCHSEIACCSIA